MTTRTIKRRFIPTPVAALQARIPIRYLSAEISLAARIVLSARLPTKVAASKPAPTSLTEQVSTVLVAASMLVSFHPRGNLGR